MGFNPRLPEMEKLYCTEMISAAAVAYRPLLISEAAAIVGLPPEVEPRDLVTKTMPMFLEVYKDTLCFRHLSARRYIKRTIGKPGLGLQHSWMTQRSLEILLKRLDPKHDDTTAKSLVPEARTDYTTTMWIKHLCDSDGRGSGAYESVVRLLSIHLVPWLKLLRPRSAIQEALAMMLQLKAVIRVEVSVLRA